jgi:putative FmdB family regulatory protein
MMRKGSEMPIFEFVCQDCQKPFEELVRSASAVDSVACPSCGSGQVKKKLSTFASRISGGNSLSLGGGSFSSSGSSCSTGSV